MPPGRGLLLAASVLAALAALAALAGCREERRSAVPATAEATATATAPGAPAAKASAGLAAAKPVAAPIAPAVAPGYEVAILAGGCFWGMEELLRGVVGVIETEVGYVGGDPALARYELVSGGDTGHAESVKVVFDPKRLSYAELLERWYFRMHDPTTVDRQGNDRGSQYRSTIFYTSMAQQATAREVRDRVDRSGAWPAPVVTTLEPAGVFTAAEADHQDYLQRNPDGYTCHFLRE